MAFFFDFLLRKKEFVKRRHRVGAGEVMLIIHCTKEKLNKVKEILFDHYTVGLQVLEDPYKIVFINVYSLTVMILCNLVKTTLLYERTFAIMKVSLR
ncbi:MAG: hypothetical protein LRY71_01425 [Bacillaceae bacterium]|nr:hypothetical protein [Bacillaceae bacterium]